MLLLEQAVGITSTATDVISARRWITNIRPIKNVLAEKDGVDSRNSHDLVFDGYNLDSTLNSKL